MRGVEIDTERRVARVEAGVVWEEVGKAAAEHGLAALAGSSSDVGVVGYTLGGGISWLGRRYGLAANNVVAVELVNADGEHVRVDADHEPELFWALRGGGGSFGIVTALEFSLFPVSEVYAGILFFPLERGREVLRAWKRWVEDVPDEVTSVGRFLQFPPVPAIPEHLRGGSFVAIEATCLLQAREADELLRPLRDLGPTMDTFATLPIEQLRHLHMDPEHPVPGVGDGMLLDDFPAEAIDAIVAAAGTASRSPLLSVEVRHLGGALRRADASHGALASIEAGFAMFAVGTAMTPEMGAAVKAHLEVLQSVLARWDAGRDYLNFTERRVRGERFYGDLTHRRLQAVKSAVDPEDVFRSNHPIRLPARRLRKVA
jgi:FAD binding domain/Berberine and berberine like